MRTLLVAASGLVLSCSFVFATGYLGKSKAAGAIVFMVLWLIFLNVFIVRGMFAWLSRKAPVAATSTAKNQPA